MTHNRVRRRRPRNVGDVAALRRMLWACLLEAEYQLQTADELESILKCIHAVATTSGIYLKLVETSDLEQRLGRLEAALAVRKPTNGHVIVGSAS